MTSVRTILEDKHHRLLSIGPDATVYEALQAMAHFDVGSLVVLDGERLVGVFSERDYARKIILLGKRSQDTRVREIMNDSVPCVAPDQSVDDCMGLMTDKRVRHLPVLDGDRVVGVVSIGDVVKEVISAQRHTINELEHYIRS
ncbi:MAG: CBS domain-containing protein [Sandaracinaceae bacterium]